jgi:AAHS family 4-hydroxybenzoate transporter-like MFS transporter
VSKERSLDLEAIIDSRSLSRFQIAIIVLCALVAMIDGFDTQSIAFVAPEIARAWHVNAAQFGPVFGAGLFGGLIGAMIFGFAGDRFGRKPTLLCAVLLFAAGSLLTPLADSIPSLFGYRFVTGLGLGGALPGIISITSEYAPQRARATIVGLMFCGFPLGAVIGGIASSKLIPAFGWTSVFLAGGIIPLLVLPLFLWFVPESIRFLAMRRQSGAIAKVLERMGSAAEWNGQFALGKVEAHSPVSSLFTEGRALGTFLLWATIFLSLLLTYFLINWIPIVARQAGFDIESAVRAVALLNLGAILGCALLGRLADRYGPAVVIGLAYAFGAAAIALLGQAGQSAALLLTIAFAAGFLSIGAQMCAVALCASFYDTYSRATGVGASMGVGRIGAIVGPVIGGMLLAAGVGAPVLFIVAGLTSFGAALAVLSMGWFVLRPLHRRTAGESRPRSIETARLA